MEFLETHTGNDVAIWKNDIDISMEAEKEKSDDDESEDDKDESKENKDEKGEEEDKEEEKIANKVISDLEVRYCHYH